MAITLTKYKRCWGCGQYKIAEQDFHRHPTGKGGRNRRCKVCISAAKRAYAQSPAGIAAKNANREANNAKRRERYQRRKAKRAAIAIDCNPVKAGD